MNAYFFATYRYPWLKDIQKSLSLIVKFLEGYTSLIQIKIARWLHPPMGKLKWNIDRAVKDDIGLMALCIRD